MAYNDHKCYQANGFRKTSPKPERRIQERDFSLDLSGKHVFGAYFNMAQTNFIKTILYINSVVGIKGNYDTAKDFGEMLHKILLIQSKRSNELSETEKNNKKELRKLTLKPEQESRMLALLYKHFPVLRPMMADVADFRVYQKNRKSGVKTASEEYNDMRGVSFSDCLEVIYLIWQTLNESRNFYTHKRPYNPPEELREQYLHQEKIAKKLDKVVVASRRVLKDREGLTTKELEFLTGIDHLHAVSVKNEKGEIDRDDKGRPKKRFEEYEDFYFKISGKRSTSDIPSATEDDIVPALSDFGLLFFCALFLSKNYARLLMEETRLFEYSPFSEQENMILREMLSIYRIRIPKKNRINSNYTKDSLALDIFNELSRCPVELYELLDKTDGQPFFHDVVKHPNEYTPEISKRIRYSDRFPQLALRYIDETNLFSRIRFQLRLGSFRYKFYNKTCIDGQVRVRRLQKEINGYGRLQEVEERKYIKWEDLLQKYEERDVKLEHEDEYLTLDQFVADTADSTPYVTDRRSVYNIHANRIGLMWEGNDFKFDEVGKDNSNKPILMYLPELTVDQDGRAPIKMPAPKCTLSVRELPAMLFYEYLRKCIDVPEGVKKPETAENIIMNCEKEYRNFFQSIADGNLMPFRSKNAFDDYLADNYSYFLMSDIPEKIKSYLLGGTTDKNTTKEAIAHCLMQQFEEKALLIHKRLDRYVENRNKIGSKDNKIGKKGFADINHGKMARLLVESIVEWQPATDNGSNKLTSLNYEILIGILATFGVPKATEEIQPADLEAIFKNAGLLNGNSPHPFLANVVQKHNPNLEALYSNYLKEELKHIDRCRKMLSGNPSETTLSAMPMYSQIKKKCKSRTEEDVRALARRYTTIQLPDGLFTPYILEIFDIYFKDNKELQQGLMRDLPLNLDPTLNAAYLISLYYKTVLKDQSQPFYCSDKSYTKKDRNGKEQSYSFRRAYNLFSILEGKRESTFPYELKPCHLTCEEIQERLSAKVVDESGKPKPVLENGKPKRDEQGNIQWQRQIAADIDSYVARLTDKDLKLSPRQSKEERSAKREAVRKRLRREINAIKATERTIRRYKTQDMVAFLLAKDIFVNIVSEKQQPVNPNNIRLANVCDDAFLSKAFKFYFPIYFAKKDNGKVIEERVILVEQENMSIKNYGEFYRLNSDDRMESLLNYIYETLETDIQGRKILRYSDLMAELANYDRQRSAVFELIHILEDKIIKENDILYHPEEDGFYVDEKRKLPKRNSFKALVALLDNLGGEKLTDAERRLINDIRKSFSHNTYDKIDFSLIRNIKNLPEIAKSIKKHLELMVKE